MKKKLFLGILIGALLTYLSARGICFQDVLTGLKAVRYVYVLPAVLIFFLMQVLRSWRWGIILSPIVKLDQLSLFSITSIGFLAIVALPARLGELARPYLITKKSQIKMTAALGTVFIERILDILTVLFILMIVLFLAPLPAWLVEGAKIFSVAIILLFALITLLIFKREPFTKIVNYFINKLPAGFATRITPLVDHFIDGFAVMTNPIQLLAVIFLSAFIWFIDGIAIYFLFLAFSLPLSPVAAFVLMIVLVVGIAIPAAPGFVGNWHYFCIMGLSLYGINKVDALTFAVVYHFLSIGVLILLGLIFLPFNKFSLTDIQKSNQTSI
jgi:uncharacterized protein (TIRG00374 family)